MKVKQMNETTLTPEQIAAMVADIVAGTPGPWQLEELTSTDPNGDETMDGVEVTAGRRSVHSYDLGYDDGAVDASIYANASRIARLPDLEAAYLALQAEARDAAYVAGLGLALRAIMELTVDSDS